MYWAWWDQDQRWVYDRRGHTAYLERVEYRGQLTLTLTWTDSPETTPGFLETKDMFDRMTSGVRVRSHKNIQWAILPCA